MGDKETLQSAPAKRSFFKHRPAWAASPSTPSSSRSPLRADGDQRPDDESHMFSRSADTLARLQQRPLPNIVSKAETHGKEQAASRHGSTVGSSEASKRPQDAHDSKRRRLSSSPLEIVDGRMPPKKQQQDKAIEILNGSDDQDKDLPVSSIEEQTPSSNPEEDEDETALNALEARLRQRRWKAEQDAQLREQQRPPPSASQTLPASSDSNPNDPVVGVLVHSSLPGTGAMLIRRRLTQSLGPVKKAWCTRYQIDPASIETLCMVWRKRYIYNTTTCKSLGVFINSQGQLHVQGDSLPIDDEKNPLEMEIMTEEAFRQLQTQSDARTEQEEVPLATDDSVRIVLKAKDLKDYKLKVKSTTRFEQVLSVFRKQRGVAADKEVFLMFDGDRLDPDTTFADSDVADMDHIDVYIK